MPEGLAAAVAATFQMRAQTTSLIEGPSSMMSMSATVSTGSRIIRADALASASSNNLNASPELS